MNANRVVKTTETTVVVLAKTLMLAGVAGAVLIAPNALQAFEQFSRQKYKRTTKTYANYLRRSGYFVAREQDGKVTISLSPKGLELVRKHVLHDYTVPQQNTWDGKWHLLLFDIPERFKKTRAFLSIQLKSSGTVLMHDSVYASPYPLDELHALIVSHFPEVKPFIARVDNALLDPMTEARIRKLFALKPYK